ncbi:MAG TPA: hypothetical protein VGC79_08150 [Polyangiaceae bacterium]
MITARQKAWGAIAGGVALALGSAGIYLYGAYFADGAPRHFEDPREHFKYGSYGSEKTGLPYLIWKALPQVCPDLLPGGWPALGFYTEPGKDLPVGISLRKYGVLRVGLNCAACHAGTLQGAPGQPAELILGMPNVHFDAQGYSQFVLGCALSDHFTADNVIAAAEQVGAPLGWLDRLVYRAVVIKNVREAALDTKQQLAWMNTRPAHGPGRTDTANLFRMQLDQNPGGDTIPGIVDYPSLWNQGLRAEHGGGQHWDGDNDSYRERSYTSALASGATQDSLDAPGVDRVSDWTTKLPPPAFPAAIDGSQAQLGKMLWLREGCHDCHDFDGSKSGSVLPLEVIGTDPGRVLSFTANTAAAFTRLGVDKPWHITHYRKTNGYLNVWTDGVWARGPYLHNGSVPTLYDLLLPPAERPAEFFRGCSTLDTKKVGWACTTGFRFRTTLSGNGNQGHEYGTKLRDEQRWALVEYMKSL